MMFDAAVYCIWNKKRHVRLDEVSRALCQVETVVRCALFLDDGCAVCYAVLLREEVQIQRHSQPPQRHVDMTEKQAVSPLKRHRVTVTEKRN